MNGHGQVTLPSWLSAIVRIYYRIMAVLAAILMVVIITVMGVQVFFRYVLNDSLIWAEELSSYMLIVLSFMLLGVAFERGEMVKLDYVMARVPRWLRSTAALLTYSAMIACLLYLAYHGYRFAQHNENSTIPALDFIVSAVTGEEQVLVLSRFWLYLLIPGGFAVLSLHLFIALLRNALNLFGWDLRHARPVDPLATFESD